jgi:NADH dehydrogenase [ubiquinone] 1 alpha subcomplex assembly factor 7
VTPLERALRDRIKSEGPITLEAYMDACNAYYYATRDPLGQRGDFTTAPEISQMFGEMIGATLADSWIRAGEPADAAYAELGPGRGTLAADALRVLRARDFAGGVHFVETSPVLRDLQLDYAPDAHWHDRIEDLPHQPLLLVANEFLDALPVRQFVDGIERRVVIAAGGFAFDRDGEVTEISPAREHAVRAIASHLVAHGGVALVIDYGHEVSAAGDTFQAMRGHCFSPVLDHPGEQDLTSHVDFQIVSEAARDVGAEVTPLAGQGEWLKRLGIEARAAKLASSNPDRADRIQSALTRLTAPDQMGALFKAMAIHAPGWPAPAGFA